MSVRDFLLEKCRNGDGTVAADGLFVDGVYYYPEGMQYNRKETTEINSILRRSDLSAVLGHFQYGIHSQIKRRSTYFSLVRNPVERILSLFAVLRKMEADVVQGLSIEEFVNEPCLRLGENDQVRRLAGNRPEDGPCTDTMLARAKANIQRDFASVGTTETFDASLRDLCERVGWKFDQMSYRANVNPGRMKRTDLSDEALRKVEQANRLDIDLYKYVRSTQEAQGIGNTQI